MREVKWSKVWSQRLQTVQDLVWGGGHSVCEKGAGWEAAMESMETCVWCTIKLPWDNLPSGEPPGIVCVPYENNIFSVR